MKTIVLTACMILAPTKCKEVKLNYFESPVNTPLVGLFEASKWATNNPNWYVKKINCVRRNEHNI